MSAKQVEQFEAYRRSGLKAAAVRKVGTGTLRTKCGCHLTDPGLNVTIAGSTHRPPNQRSECPTGSRHCEGVYW